MTNQPSDGEIPYRFPGSTSAQSVIERFGTLSPGEESGTKLTVAGRVMRNRPQGRVVFCELRDWTGAVQLFAQDGQTERFEQFRTLGLGDWVGAHGEVIRTRRGELSVRVERWSLLAEARRGFGDKWRGVHDVEVRFRQREVDLWANEGVRDSFLLRSKLISYLRKMLDERGFVEVETPVLQPIPGGANARPFVTHFNALHADFYLRIAPELYLKRLVVGGFERVYELARVFRNEGLSTRHNPEFTMLEAYQVYADYLDMAELIEALVAGAATELLGSTEISHQGRPLDLSTPWRRVSMVEAIEEQTGIGFELEMGRDELAKRAANVGLEVGPGDGPGKIMLEVFEKSTEPNLFDPVHVTDYPEEVSPLTRRHRDKPGYVERLTPIIAGREIAEVYSELVDPFEQRVRLAGQQAARLAGDEEAMSLDEDFLRALEHGMPPTGGIGLGVDRLAMLLADKSNIKEVMLFPALRPDQPEQVASETPASSAGDGPVADELGV